MKINLNFFGKKAIFEYYSYLSYLSLCVILLVICMDFKKIYPKSERFGMLNLKFKCNND